MRRHLVAEAGLGKRVYGRVQTEKSLLRAASMGKSRYGFFRDA